MTLYKINPLRIQKIPLTIKNYPWPCGSKLRSRLFISTMIYIIYIYITMNIDIIIIDISKHPKINLLGPVQPKMPPG